MDSYHYGGTELDLFAAAQNWKSYWRRELVPFLRGAVLEVGAGNGNNTRFLQGHDCSLWVCLEPDSLLSSQVLARGTPACRTEVLTGTVSDLPAHSRFDTILYLDVLEHIEDDAGELRRAIQHLRQDGHLIVLAPAHQWLYSPFDQAVGHERRYSQHSLRRVVPNELSLISLRYLDSAGLLASLANRIFLRQGLPTTRQLRVWDSYLVPISRRTDGILRHRVGKSVLGVWRNARAGTAA